MTETTPTGTVTFLFTDIEGSTRLWEQRPEAMKAVLARHDAILRQVVSANEGYMVKTTGDGCHAAFQTAACAIAATLAGQQALQAESWAEIHPQTLRIRMGVHTGEAEARAGDYYGSAVNRAARLMSVGYGGQVLVSAVTASLVRDLLPAETALLDLGEHRLKDLVAPEHIYQLACPGLPSSFPALKSLDAYPNNLPSQLTTFVGREREINEAKRLLAARLVTFTGSGGTGKTRLALQVAADMLSTFADGVWFVELAPVSDPNSVVQALATALELRGAPGIPLLDFVTAYLRSRRVLLVLDNCEHLIDACARLAEHLLRACPALAILATSREGLGIAGEVSYRVPSLSLPALENASPDTLAASEAGQLYLERATAANPRFAFTPSSTRAVAQICQRLDGIPLALELAAARSKLFSAEQIATRLDDRFRLLTGGSRTALPRQQTLRAMIDWSHEMLAEPERALLRQLSVFAGGWTFEAADAVCADLDVLTLLEQLVNKSLVVMDEIQGQARYHMLETIRQYARDKLLDAGEGARLRDRHLDYFLSLSEEAEQGLRGEMAFEWLDRLALDAENFRAAIEWGQEGRAEETLLLAGDLMFFFMFRFDNDEQALCWLNNLLSKVNAMAGDEAQSKHRPLARCRGLTAIGLLNQSQGNTAASQAALTVATALARDLDDRFYLALLLWQRSLAAFMTGDMDPARGTVEEAVRLMRTPTDERWRLIFLPAQAAFESLLGNSQRAAQLRQEVSQHLDQAYHPMSMGALTNLGEEARHRRQPREAQVYYTKGLAIARRVKSRHFAAVMESELAHLARERGELQAAKAAYAKLILTWKDLGQFPAVAHQLECFAVIAQAEQSLERAVLLFGAAEALREALHAPRRPDEEAEHEQIAAALRNQMEADAFATVWAQGCAMDMDQAIQYAVAPPPAAQLASEK